MTETASSAVPAAQTLSDESRSAYGFGVATIATRNGEATVLDAWFPAPALGVAAESLRSVENADESLTTLAAEGDDDARGTQQKVVFAQINLDEAPADTVDAYLRLHLLSHRLVKPNSINLDGVFGKLPNVVWTNFGPAAVEGFELTRAKLRKRGPRPAWTGSDRRLPSDRPPVLTPKELAAVARGESPNGHPSMNSPAPTDVPEQPVPRPQPGPLPEPGSGGIGT